MNSPILTFISVFFRLFSFLIFFRVLMSWVKPRPNSLTYFISDITDPYLNFIKRFIPPVGMIDFSPIVALLLLDVMQSVLLSVLV
ncbi:YggT family protein [bacterium]|nr:YggT family protein [bacterium]MBT6293873.1 YggT family protein [bacterium]